MRNAFADEVTRLARKDSRIVLLAGDIGNRLFNDFKDIAPQRFFNCGVAEANMTGVAAGMAVCGLRPITYTITPFNTTRCLEQIRVDVCYHNLPVIIVGVGAGLSYANLGATHHSCEDIAMLRVLPNMTVMCPADVVELRLGLRAALRHNGPVYIRIGKKNEPVLHKTEPEFNIGKAIVLKQGAQICLISTGNMLAVAAETSGVLEQKNISVQLVSMPTVKPLDTEFLSEAFNVFDIVVAIEEHSLLGGFSSQVAEWVVDQPMVKSRFLRFGTPDEFLHSVGNQQSAREIIGLSAGKIARKILSEMG